MRWRDVRALLLRLHFYAGVLIGPFLLVAATTGLMYTVTPQLEPMLYRHELTVAPHGPAGPLAAQVAAAKQAVPKGKLESVSTGPGATDSTRVVFDVPGLPDGYSTTAFVDPYDQHVLGTLRTFGRNYSELAASWLWVEVLAGLALWLGAPRTRRRLRRFLLPRAGTGKRRHAMSWHGAVGLWAAIGLLGLSATGLTWSAHAGANISAIRATIGGATPAVSTALPRSHGGAARARPASPTAARQAPPVAHDQGPY